MSPFTPRPFPPLSLGDVPIEYITQQLHALAPQYWDKPETADCTIIVPIPHLDPSSTPFDNAHSFTTSYEPQPSSAGRRATQPPLNAVPRISLQLHMDFLSAHSTYLRGLFSGACPLDLMFSTTPPTSTSSIPANRLPRLMPCSPDHPVLFLPVPDPSSFHLLVHWMYFGDSSYIGDCLHRGIIQWEGIARNVEYLGLPSDIKVFLSHWYDTWLNPDAERAVASDEDSDSDTACSDSDDDDTCSLTPSELDQPVVADSHDEKEPSRGRTRATRPLSFQSARTPSL
ncbi:hypothetical protein K443DRAFT_85427 [Laccaria amethystina LaAM-08-1]|uniref:BTB domain-containing protein n=1 Tax=Laccaria amethystina LaAM-08-1 TaxID=1095629 RepID=A0A0C9Y2X8_9AGAR|nr:hypothetical protein K443DRAFT_85427 [Laccaria amethystina LaAM-08-1]